MESNIQWMICSMNTDLPKCQNLLVIGGWRSLVIHARMQQKRVLQTTMKRKRMFNTGALMFALTWKVNLGVLVGSKYLWTNTMNMRWMRLSSDVRDMNSLMIIHRKIILNFMLMTYLIHCMKTSLLQYRMAVTVQCECQKGPNR